MTLHSPPSTLHPPHSAFCTSDFRLLLLTPRSHQRTAESCEQAGKLACHHQGITVPPPLIAVIGPTASGKSLLAEGLAERLGLQLVNADAFMVYRGLDVGTNKPADKQRYALLDLVGPTEEFGVGEYVRLAAETLQELHAKGKGAVVVGGTGLYVRALFEGYTDMMPAPDPALRQQIRARLKEEGLESLAAELAAKDPKLAAETDLRNPVRVCRALERLADPRPPVRFELPPFRQSKFALLPDPRSLEKRIAERVEGLFQAGWRAEVEQLLAKGVPRTAPAMRAIGYDTVVDLIDGRLGPEEARARIVALTRQYARRQRTWLRSEPRTQTIERGPLSAPDVAETIEMVMDCLQ